MTYKQVLTIPALLIAASMSCMGQAQSNSNMTNKTTTHPLLCDPATGVCEIPGIQHAGQTMSHRPSKEQPIKVIYFTDPICSSCWGIEPQLRKLKLEYGDHIEIDYRMGGLLPDWNYSSGGINNPSDVAHHWDEASEQYDMPIDGDVWLEDPLYSSYPPSIAFKAAQLQDKDKAVLFLREIRELLFLHKKNIAKWEHIATAAQHVGLDVGRLKVDYESRAKALFEEDLKVAREYGVRGFPTMFFIDGAGNKEMVYGSRPYPFYETAILKLYPRADKGEYIKSWESLFSRYATLTAKEFSELSGTPRSESEKVLDDLVVKKRLEKTVSKNGAIWKLCL